jgi:hypothetical protein
LFIDARHIYRQVDRTHREWTPAQIGFLAIPDAARGADVIKRLLSNLGTIDNGLAELRGLYGTGHGKHGSSLGLSARHAKLAVGAASTLAVFLFETHKETKS